MHPTLNIAIKAARRAGQIINRASLDIGQLKVSTKQQNDYVTEVDKAAEAAIIDTLRETYPKHAILAEETGHSGQEDSEYQWIIDPLDGTTNFIHGFPQYAVSIAMAHKGVLTHAVVYDPDAQRTVHRQQGRRRLPQRQAHSRLEARQARRSADRHRLPLSHVRPCRCLSRRSSRK